MMQSQTILDATDAKEQSVESRPRRVICGGSEQSLDEVIQDMRTFLDKEYVSTFDLLANIQVYTYWLVLGR